MCLYRDTGKYVPVSRLSDAGIITIQAHFFGVPSVCLYRVFTVPRVCLERVFTLLYFSFADILFQHEKVDFNAKTFSKSSEKVRAQISLLRHFFD